MIHLLLWTCLSWGAEQMPPPSVLPDVSSEENSELNESEENQINNVTEDKSTGATEEEHNKGVPWTAPVFSGQTDSLGWTPHAFDIPPGFKRRVQFWTDIYTKYSTHQALLHDAQDFNIIYKIVDFTEIENSSQLNLYEKNKAKKKLIKEEKSKIREMLGRLDKFKDSPSKLDPADLEVYQKFRFVTEKNKFRIAAQRNHLRMQLGEKDRFLLGLYFSGRYIREMERLFREEGVPIELTRLPFVESSFNLYAYSHVGASGIWQFMRSTGRLYKLKIDPVRDLRNDPLAATRAAAQMLRFNFKLLGSWPLALTAYNHGPQGVSRITKELKTTDINEIVWNTTHRRFGFASENFYAEFLAALEVESHASKYFGRVEVSAPLQYEEVNVPRPLKFGELALAMSGDPSGALEKARLYNPYLTRGVLSGRGVIPAGTSIRVPVGGKDRFLTQLGKVDPVQVKSLQLQAGVYRVLPGDTLSTISRDFGIVLKELLQANQLQRNALLRPGQRIVIPTLENH